MTQPYSVTRQQPMKVEIKQEDVFANSTDPLQVDSDAASKPYTVTPHRPIKDEIKQEDVFTSALDPLQANNVIIIQPVKHEVNQDNVFTSTSVPSEMHKQNTLKATLNRLARVNAATYGEPIETSPLPATQPLTDYSSSEQECTSDHDYQIQPTTGRMPSVQGFLGDYCFEVLFNSTSDKHKSWIYSSNLNKLYIDINQLCPISFRVCHQLPNLTRIRALPIFTEAQFMSKPVKRCLIHCNEAHVTNEGFAWPHHLIRCDHPDASYEEDPNSNRLSVVVPLEDPQPGSDTVCRMFKFMCLSSCVGGLSRRPIKVIFTLETEDGAVIGRHAISVKICSCPNRDQKKEEKNKNVGKQEEKVQRLAQELTENCNRKRQLPSKEKLFFVPVYGRSNYELVRKYAEQLEMAEKFASEYPAEAQDLKAKRAELEKQFQE